MNQTLGENERLPPIFGEPGAAGGDQQQGAAGGDQQGGQGHQGAVGGAEEVAQALVLLLRHHWVGGELKKIHLIDDVGLSAGAKAEKSEL